MSIFIEGLDLPEKIEPELVIEFAEGISGKRYVRLHHYKIGSLTDWCEVVSVPPHGDLIDRSKIHKAIPTEEDNCIGMGMSYDEMDAYNDGIDAMYDLVQKAKPIIEAEPKSYDDCLNKN